MIDKATITEYLDKLLDNGAEFLVSVEMLAGGVIDICIDSDNDVSVNRCADVNEALRNHFGAELDNYEVIVGSYGLTSPLVLPRQFAKNIDREVEVLTDDGRKLHGILQHADDNGFTVAVQRKVRPEGKKRPEIITEPITVEYRHNKRTVCSVTP